MITPTTRTTLVTKKKFVGGIGFILSNFSHMVIFLYDDKLMIVSPCRHRFVFHRIFPQVKTGKTHKWVFYHYRLPQRYFTSFVRITLTTSFFSVLPFVTIYFITCATLIGGWHLLSEFEPVKWDIIIVYTDIV